MTGDNNNSDANDKGAGADDGKGGDNEDNSKEQDSKDNSRDGLQGDDLKQALSDTRKEAAAGRIENKELKKRLDRLQDGLSKALGIDSSEGNDMDALAKDIAGMKSSLLTERVKNAFHDAADEHKANYRLTYAVLSAEGILDSLDPDSETFKKDISKAVKNVLKEQPELKSKTPVGQNGSDFSGDDTKPANMNDLIRGLPG